MEGDFVLGYLGNTIIAKATASGLGTIQKPLRDAYFEYRKTSGKKSKKKDLTEVGLRVSPQGIYILIAGSHPGSNESFYDMQSVSFFEAVTFKTVKGTDKKLQAGFLPIDINRSPNTGSEKLFTPLDKKYQNFAKMDHPAILALVMRRTTGVRALECHAFICEDDRQALAIVNMIGTLQERGTDPRVMDYQRPYDPYGGPSRRPDNFQSEFRDPDPGFPRGQMPPPDRWDPPDSDSRQMGSDPRGMLGHSRNDRLMPSQHYDDGGRRLGDSRYPADEVAYRHERQRSSEYGRGEEYGDRRSGDFRHERQRSGDFRHERQGSGDFRHERQRSGDYGREVDPRYADEEVRFRHERQRSNELRASEHYGDRRSGDYAGDRRSGGIFHERQRSGEITPRDELRSSRDMHDFGRQSRPEARPEGPMRYPRPMSPGRPGPATAPKPTRALSPGPYQGGDYQQRQPLRSPRDERGPPPPTGPEYSLSSLESRQEMENRPNKPVARVPPHLVAGVKVLPTGFRASIQQKAGQKPPRSPGDERRAIVNEEDEENPYDNAMSRREFYKKEGRNALSESERYFDEPGKESRYVYHPPNPPDVLPVEERERQRDNVKKSDLNDYDRVIRRDTNFNDPHGQNANYRYSAPPVERGRDTKPWSYDEQFQKFSREKESDDLKRPNYSGGEFKFYDSSKESGGRKAYEVQDQFSKMNIQNQKGGLNTAGTNFEESLGYFP